MRRALALIVAGLLIGSPAAAHNTWRNGEAVSDEIKHRCCGDNDVHHLCPSGTAEGSQGNGCDGPRVWEVEGGYDIEGFPHKDGKPDVEYDKAKPSPDGEWWAFYSFPGGTVYCFFMPYNM
jgi:hypothetical protein